MIHRCTQTTQVTPKTIAAPPGMGQLEPQDRYEPGPPGKPDFLKMFQEALAEQNRQKAMANQMLEMIQGGRR